MGPSVRLQDATEMIGETPAALLPVVEEAMGAGIFAAAESVFSFRHQLLRRAGTTLSFGRTHDFHRTEACAAFPAANLPAAGATPARSARAIHSDDVPPAGRWHAAGVSMTEIASRGQRGRRDR
jgi:hypothetical protein